jgi:hypothetical protein
MIDLVIATDMKQHFALVGQFRAVHSTDKSAICAALGKSIHSINSCTVSSSGSPSVDAHSTRISRPTLLPMDDKERVLTLQVLGGFQFPR